jgi:2-methylisocitrate lyase-like PEP mutase family enzyme
MTTDGPAAAGARRSSAAAQLRAMHAGPRPLVLPNVWDCASARAFTEAGFAALATSSSAVAATLGYRDGQTPAGQMLAAVGRIAGSVGVPVTADIEDGYGLPPAELVARLAEAGVAGCNLEDSDPATRALADPARQADFIAAVRAAAGAGLVINARVDAFLRMPGGLDPAPPEAVVAEAVARARRYLAAGADCCYPILAPAGVLPRLTSEIDGPVNAMYVPQGPSLRELADLGVARISFGGGLHARATHALGEIAAALAASAAGATARHDQLSGSESMP